MCTTANGIVSSAATRRLRYEDLLTLFFER